jgi:hypothetical protein
MVAAFFAVIITVYYDCYVIPCQPKNYSCLSFGYDSAVKIDRFGNLCGWLEIPAHSKVRSAVRERYSNIFSGYPDNAVIYEYRYGRLIKGKVQHNEFAPEDGSAVLTLQEAFRKFESVNSAPSVISSDYHKPSNCYIYNMPGTIVRLQGFKCRTPLILLFNHETVLARPLLSTKERTNPPFIINRSGEYLHTSNGKNYKCHVILPSGRPVLVKNVGESKSMQLPKDILTKARYPNELVYELRMSMLVPGCLSEIDGSYHFIPEIGGKVISLNDYFKAVPTRRIYNYHRN